jgi:hypothetical protein
MEMIAKEKKEFANMKRANLLGQRGGLTVVKCSSNDLASNN